MKQQRKRDPWEPHPFEVPACLSCPTHPALWVDATLHAAVCPRCGRSSTVLPTGARVALPGRVM